MASVIPQTPYNEHTANGVTTLFGYTFQLLDADDLKVYVNGAPQVSSTYTITGIGGQAGGSVTFLSAPANGEVVLLSREIALERDIDYQTNGDLRARTVNLDFNRLWQALQGQEVIAGAALRLPYPQQTNPLQGDLQDRLIYFNAGQPVITPFTQTQVASAVAAAYGTGSTLDALTFVQAGLGAVPRTAQAKAREQLSLADFGPAATGVANDSPHIMDVITEANARGGSTVKLAAAASGYGVDRPFVGSQRGLSLLPGVSLKGDNTKLVLLGNSEFIYLGRPQDRADTTFVSFYGVTPGVDYSQITADTTTTDTTLTVNPGDEAAFVAGDLAYVRLGQAVYDSAEPDWFYFAKVVSTASGSVTLDRPTGYALSVAATPNNRQRRIIKVNGMPENVLLEGLYLQGATSGTPNAEFGIHFRYARNITMRNISGRDVGPGLIGGQFGENILIQNVSLDQCSARGQASKGRMFSFAECKGVTVEGYRAENFAHVMAFIEGGCEQVRFIDGVVVNNATGRANTDQIFFLAGAKDLHVDGLRLEGNPCTIVQSSSDAKLIPPFLRNASCSPSFAPAFGTITRWFDVDHVDENVQMGAWFTFTKRKRFELELTLQANKPAIQNIPLPFGVYAKIRATLTGKTGILSLGLSRGTGAAIPVPSAGGLTLVNDMTVNVPFEFPKTNPYPWWLFGSGHPFCNPANDKYLYYTTDASLVAGTKVYLELEYFPAATPTILQDAVTYMAL